MKIALPSKRLLSRALALKACEVADLLTKDQICNCVEVLSGVKLSVQEKKQSKAALLQVLAASVQLQSKRGRRDGFSPIHGEGGAMTKKQKAFSMPEADWEWLESQPNQSETIRAAIALSQTIQDLLSEEPDPFETVKAAIALYRESLRKHAS